MIWLLGWLIARPPSLDPQALIARVETLYTSRTAHAIAVMEIQGEAWHRKLRMEIWSRGREDTRVRILEPPKERGVITLKRGDQIWNYIPRIDRKIKIPPGMMGDAWMGSHFTYDDMVKESKIERLYRFQVKEDTGDTLVLVGIPVEGAAVVWGKLEYVLEKKRFLPLEVRYYDEDSVLARTLWFSDVRRVGDRWIPFRLRVEPSDRPGEYTEIRYEKLELNVPLPRNLFSPASLGR